MTKHVDKLHLDRRPVAKADLVATQALKQPGLLRMIITGLSDPAVVVRLRSAAVAVKVSRQRPELLAPYVAMLLEQLPRASEPIIKCQLAQIMPRLGLAGVQRSQAVEGLKLYLCDQKRLVQTEALNALIDLTATDPAQRRTVMGIVDTMTKTGSPADRARARKLKLALLTATAPNAVRAAQA